MVLGSNAFVQTANIHVVFSESSGTIVLTIDLDARWDGPSAAPTGGPSDFPIVEATLTASGADAPLDVSLVAH